MSVMQMFRLDGKVAFVNGAGRGIGAASARALAEAGADVAIRARTAAQLEAVAADIRELGRRALVLPASDEDGDDTAALARAAAELGRLDVLVSVIGGSMPGPFMASTDQTFNEAFEFNVTGPVRMARAAVPLMLEGGGGSIVNISTNMAHTAARGYSVYGTVKAALDHATRLLAMDLSPRIRVNAVAPGATQTEALEMILQNDEIREAMVGATPLRRIGSPEDIAAAVLYLASPASAYMTGKILHVDGGLQVPNFDLHLPDL